MSFWLLHLRMLIRFSYSPLIELSKGTLILGSFGPLGLSILSPKQTMWLTCKGSRHQASGSKRGDKSAECATQPRKMPPAYVLLP